MHKPLSSTHRTQHCKPAGTHFAACGHDTAKCPDMKRHHHLAPVPAKVLKVPVIASAALAVRDHDAVVSDRDEVAIDLGSRSSALNFLKLAGPHTVAQHANDAPEPEMRSWHNVFWARSTFGTVQGPIQLAAGVAWLNRITCCNDSSLVSRWTAQHAAMW